MFSTFISSSWITKTLSILNKIFEYNNYEGSLWSKISSMLGSFLLAFLAGLIAIVTPCVFPMIPMTVAFFAKGAKKAGDEMWIARYLLDRLTENYGYYIEYHPKPIKGDWNGSGMHANFSNEVLRTCGSKEMYEKICESFRPVAQDHIDVYGEFNDQRLTWSNNSF